MNNLKENYWAPTPLKWRKLGDALLAASTVIGTYAISVDYKWMGISSVVLGVIGKFLSNFFTEPTT